MCFDMIKVIKDLHLLKSKVVFLKSTKNAAGIGSFFYGGIVRGIKEQQIFAIQFKILISSINHSEFSPLCQILSRENFQIVTGTGKRMTYLHIISSSGGAQVLTSGDLGCKSDAPGTMDAPGHDGFDKRSEIFVLDGAFSRQLVVGKSGTVGSKGHRLILQIAFTTLEKTRPNEFGSMTARFGHKVPQEP